MTCSECPAALTPRQVKRGNVTCGRSCATARTNRLRTREQRQRLNDVLQEGRRKSAAKAVLTDILEDLRPHVGADGLVSTKAAVHLAIKWRRIGYARGYRARYAHERRVS